MKRISAVFILALLAWASQGCSIHPPDDGSSLGPEVSVDAIDQVLIQAQSGVTQDQSYHVGDTGTVQIVDNIMGSYDVRETDNYTVTSIDQNYITYSMHQVDTDTCYVGQIPRESSGSPSPSPSPSQTPQTASARASWIRHIVKIVKNFKKSVSHLLARVTVQPSTALGQAKPLKVSADTRIMAMATVRKLDTLTPVPCNSSGMAAATPTPSASPTTSPSASPTPDPTPTPDTSGANVTHHYYNLSSFTHKLTTNNCAQLSDCKVTSTQVNYDDVQTDANGDSTRVHWMWEISTQVPGLFVIMQQCYSSLVVQNGEVLPLTRCQNVEDFRYGSPPN